MKKKRERKNEGFFKPTKCKVILSLILAILTFSFIFSNIYSLEFLKDDFIFWLVALPLSLLINASFMIDPSTNLGIFIFLTLILELLYIYNIMYGDLGNQ
jgi:hypothetical protein